MKYTLGAIAVAAALAFAGGIATSANAGSSNGTTKATSDKQTVSDTDISSHRRHWRRYGYVRPYRSAYPHSYGYYRPRPHYYRPYSHGYYPSAYYHRPYYYRPAPVFSIGFGFGPSFGFGPRHYW